MTESERDRRVRVAHEAIRAHAKDDPIGLRLARSLDYEASAHTLLAFLTAGEDLLDQVGELEEMLYDDGAAPA
jgi:hypothetical protein